MSYFPGTTFTTFFSLFFAFLTTDSRDGPVTADDGGMKRQLEDEWSDVGISVCIHSRNVDRAHVGSFADLSIVRNQ